VGPRANANTIAAAAKSRVRFIWTLSTESLASKTNAPGIDARERSRVIYTRTATRRHRRSLTPRFYSREQHGLLIARIAGLVAICHAMILLRMWRGGAPAWHLTGRRRSTIERSRTFGNQMGRLLRTREIAAHQAGIEPCATPSRS
jgi:hypothetical protein